MALSRALRTAALALAACAVLAAGAVPAWAQTVDDILKRGKVRIGVLIGAPPYGSIDAEGKPVGYDADVANLVAKYLGVPIEMVPLTPPARIPALESGKADFLIATLAPTAERAKAVMFTIPYSTFQMGIWAKKGEPIRAWADLRGKRVGVNRGSSVEIELTKREKELNLSISRFEDDSTTMQALFSGQVDAIAGPDAQALAAMKARGDGVDCEQKFVFARQPNSMTVRKDAFALHQYLNNVIYIMKLNGELSEISQRWVGVPLPELPTF